MVIEGYLTVAGYHTRHGAQGFEEIKHIDGGGPRTYFYKDSRYKRGGSYRHYTPDKNKKFPVRIIWGKEHTVLCQWRCKKCRVVLPCELQGFDKHLFEKHSH